jgi:cytochrome P450
MLIVGGAETTATLLTGLLYYLLSASINESLRLFPPIPGNLRRIVPKGGKLISGNWVPAGTLVAVDIMSANTYSGNFRHADEFRPERWFKDAKGFEGDKLGAVKPVSPSLSPSFSRSFSSHAVSFIRK